MSEAQPTPAPEKSVLVFMLGHMRPLLLPRGEEDTKERMKQLFGDVLQERSESDFFLQLKDENWGKFVDLLEQPILNRAVLWAEATHTVSVVHVYIDMNGRGHFFGYFVHV